MIEVKVDYLQFSTLMNEQNHRDRQEKEISGFGFYNRGYEDDLGVRTYYGNPNSKKAFVVMSGRAMHNRRKVYGDDRSQIETFLSNGVNITRIDWCITDYIEDDLVTPMEVAVEAMAGRVHGTLAKYGYVPLAKADVGQPPNIETCYIGSLKRRGDNGIFRAYDKGIDLGLSPEIMTRFELEERKENAHNNAKRYVNGAEIQSLIKSRLDFTGKRMERILEGEYLDMTRGDAIIPPDDRKKHEKRWLWLMNQVAPALRDAVKSMERFDDDNSKLLQFLENSGIYIKD